MKKTILLILGLIAALLVIPLFLPKNIEVSVERQLPYSVDLLFEEFNNVREFSQWEAWSKSDTALIFEYYSPYRGEGASFTWESNISQSEKGEIIITKSIPNDSLCYSMKSEEKNYTFLVNFTKTDSLSTAIKCSVQGEEVNYFSRYYVAITNSRLKEKMNQGFDNLEEKLKSHSIISEEIGFMSIEDIRTESNENIQLFGVYNETSLDSTEIKTAIKESIGKVYSYLKDFRKINPYHIGKATTYYYKTDSLQNEISFISGFPVFEVFDLDDDEMEFFTIQMGNNLTSVHRGALETKGKTLDKMKIYLKENNLETKTYYWEVYMNEMEAVPDSGLVTKIYLPIKIKEQ